MVGMEGHCGVQAVLVVLITNNVEDNKRAWLFADTPTEVMRRK